MPEGLILLLLTFPYKDDSERWYLILEFVLITKGQILLLTFECYDDNNITYLIFEFMLFINDLID